MFGAWKNNENFKTIDLHEVLDFSAANAILDIYFLDIVIFKRTGKFFFYFLFPCDKAESRVPTILFLENFFPVCKKFLRYFLISVRQPTILFHFFYTSRYVLENYQS